MRKGVVRCSPDCYSVVRRDFGPASLGQRQSKSWFVLPLCSLRQQRLPTSFDRLVVEDRRHTQAHTHRLKPRGCMGLIAAAAQLQGASLVVASLAVWISYSFVLRVRKGNRLPSNSMDPSSHVDANGHIRVQDDRYSIGILLALYTLQGIPMGLCSSLPVILKEKGISFEDLALLSIASIPFSLKLLWAPIVDCKFFPSIGRRKSWLVPIQFLCGLVFLLGSSLVDTWMENSSVVTLTAFFVFLYFLMATQDIAVGK